MIKHYFELEQGSVAWLLARCGLLTASEMKLVVTEKTLKPTKNDKVRAHAYELAAQRINEYVEPSYVSDDMMRGTMDEVEAKEVYETYFDDITECGFITNDRLGFNIGFSPDGLIGDNGLIEIKSRRQKFQLETIAKDEVPSEYMLQIQTGLLVTEREYCDFVSFSAGMPLFRKRVERNDEMFDAIKTGAVLFENSVLENIHNYENNVKAHDFPMTERKIYEEIVI